MGSKNRNRRLLSTLFPYLTLLLIPLRGQEAQTPDVSPQNKVEADRITIHAKLPKYKKAHAKHNLHDVLRARQGRPTEVYFSEGLMPNSPNEGAYTLDAWLQSKMCKADLIVAAQMNRVVTGLTEDATLITSDLYLTVEQVVSARAPSPQLVVGSQVIVNILGGSIQLPEGRASVIIDGFAGFEPNRSYLLFLKHLRDLPDYELVDLSAAFILPSQGPPRNIYRQVQERLSRELTSLQSETLIDRIHSIAMSSSCNGGAR
jgi:hypothetical protein